MTIYLLDRNAVIEIEKIVKGNGSPIYEKLKRLDKRKNTVSCLLSALETHKKSSRDAAAIADSIERESGVLSAFFRYARTDSSLLLSEKDGYAIGFAEEFAKNQQNDLEFIADAQRLLAKETGKDHVMSEFERVADFIRQRGRQLGDPLSMLLIACPLGSQGARKVLKPTENPDPDLSFNVLADVEKIKLKNYLQHIAIYKGVRSALKIFSEDAGLMSFSSAILVRSALSMDSHIANEVSAMYWSDAEHFISKMPFLEGRNKQKEKVIAAIIGG